MIDTSNNSLIESCLVAIEGKRKGIKHSFQSWSQKEIDNGDGLELRFDRLSIRPSRLTVRIWYDGKLSLDLRTYGKHEGWTFEHRTTGVLRESKVNELVSLIKNISIYFHQNMVSKLDKKVEDLAI